jgi:hypothetical protein
MESMSGVFSLFTALPVDWLILGGIAVVVALDSLRSGIGRAISLSLALSLALLIFPLVEQTVFIGTLEILQTPAMQAALFGALTAALFLLMRRLGFDYLDSGMGEPVQALLAGAATAVVLICVWLQVPILNDWWTFNTTIQTFFAEQYRLLWLLGAYAVLAFARG